MNIEEIKKIKKALFIENESWSSMEHQTVYLLKNRLTDLGIECIVIDHASEKQKEVFTESLNADAIFFSSTFLYPADVRGLGNLIKNIKEPKLIFGHSMDSGSVQVNIEKIWNVYELLEFSHHKIFEINNTILSNDDWCKPIDMDVYRKEVEKLEEERIKRNNGYRRISVNVLIKKIQAVGPEWSLLKEGSVVQELDCSSIDTDKKRGIWVMGKTEPVKLLNSDGYDEWEYKNPSCYQLAKEFFKKAAKYGEDPDIVRIVGSYIGKCTGKHRMSEAELWIACDDLCKTTGLERRGNREYFERRIKEHRERFWYFTDPEVSGFHGY